MISRRLSPILAPLVTFGLAAATLALSAAAHAEGGPKIRLERADVSKYPLIKVYLTYTEADGRMVTGKQREDFNLIFDSNEQGPAADAKPIEQTGEPIYVAVVAEIANAMNEVFEDEKRGIKEIARAAGELKGSQVALVTYSQDIKRVQEFPGKPEEIDGKVTPLALDTDSTEVHLLDAVRTAIDLLNSKSVPDDARKMVVVFSDGLDVAGDKKGFTELGKRALLNNIVLDTIGYAPFEKDKLKNLNEMVKQSNGTDRSCKNAQEVTAQFANVADEIRKQYVTLFQSVINGDGKEHTIQVMNNNGGKQVWSNNVTKICINNGPVITEPPITQFYKKWWFWVFCVAVPILALIFILMKVFGAKEEGTAFAGQGVEVAPQEFGSPNLIRAKGEVPGGMSMGSGGMDAPGGANRTMALDLGVLTGKGPTVGWIVGITGKYADQTFKLKAGGRTLIGTAADCDIVIDDSFMSSKHCEVQYDGNTYKIVDLGSTNGVVLNDKRVPMHDLVDGDTLRFGRTEFKFKSIN